MGCSREILDERVEFAVVVVIEPETTAATVQGSFDTGRVTHIGKRAITMALKEKGHV